MSNEIEQVVTGLLAVWITAFAVACLWRAAGDRRAIPAVAAAPFRFVGWILSGILTVIREAAEAALREIIRILRTVLATVARAVWDTFRTVVGIVWRHVSAGVAAAHRYYYGRYPRATAGVYTATAFAATVFAYFYIW